MTLTIYTMVLGSARWTWIYGVVKDNLIVDKARKENETTK